MDINEYKKVIKIKGKKDKDKIPEKLEDNIYNLREYGQFFLDIPISTDNLTGEMTKEPKIGQGNGLVILEYNLIEKPKKVIFEGTES